MATAFFGAQAAEIAAATKDAEAKTKGSLVIIGGALRIDNVPVWQRIVNLAGGKGARIAVFPTAAANPERSGQATIDVLNGYGAQAFLVPLSAKFPSTDFRSVARDTVLAATVRSAGGAYFVGGDQGRITQALLEPNGGRTPLLQAVWDMYRSGGVVAGSSAGAAIMSETMFYDAKEVLPTLQQGITDGKEIAPGLGFIGSEVFVDQHLIVRGRFARMIPAMLKKNYKLGLGVDENTAMVINPQHELEVLGYKGVIVVDLAEAKTDPKQQYFNIQNAKLSYLDRGDKFNFHTRHLTVAADKEKGKVDPDRPYYEDVKYYADVLGNTAVVDLMQKLVDSRQQQVTGLAFGSPQSAMPELGFEFLFKRTPESLGYFSSASGAEAYTVMNIRLDIRPVEMNFPLYRGK
ncbi:cyanophycinase [Undibacterium terreum]|uniref:Cyanophycinase n=1 Tax=Undibacterium terreum TaxID=1224302 RepID=A0A916XKH3_9BURK|nr:cyanophycinase [Undibacterium terreum]GGC81456.1 hypothetical protein GCM10011396_30850 [Undibacterium terreum]